MYPANDPNTTMFLAHFKMEELAAENEKRRLTREARAAKRVIDSTTPRPKRRWAWELRPWSVRPAG